MRLKLISEDLKRTTPKTKTEIVSSSKPKQFVERIQLPDALEKLRLDFRSNPVFDRAEKSPH